jgi:hypothetical protein
MNAFSCMRLPSCGITLTVLCVFIVSCGGNGDYEPPSSSSRSFATGQTAAANSQLRRSALGETTVVINTAPVPGKEGSGRADASAAVNSAFPTGISVDAAGNLYITQRDKSIRKVTPDGVVSMLPENAGSAADARSTNLITVAADAAGNLHVTDTGNCTIRRITSAGRVTTTTLPRLLSGQACPM